MKNLGFLVALLAMLFVVQGAMAQKRHKTVVKTDSTTVITTVRVVPNFAPKHDLRIGIGAASVTSIFAFDVGFDGYYYDFRQEMERADTYLTPRTFVGNYSLSYTYHDRRWLQYGGMVSFGASVERTRHSITGETLEVNNLYMIGVMPTVRFVWYWREKVQLYSSISFGVMTDLYDILPWGDVTLVGCTFGRKLFGFAEIGGGMSGVFRIGMGYRFDAAKKNKK